MWRKKRTSKKPKHIDDPVFGPLRLSFMWFLWMREPTDWEGLLEVPLLGFLDVSVEVADHRPPSDSQRNAGSRLIDSIDGSFFREIGDLLFNDAQGLSDAYPPEVRPRTRDDLWKFAEASTLAVPTQSGATRRVLLGFAVEWDLEHGRNIALENEQPIEVLEGGCYPEGWED